MRSDLGQNLELSTELHMVCSPGLSILGWDWYMAPDLAWCMSLHSVCLITQVHKLSPQLDPDIPMLGDREVLKVGVWI